MIDARRLRHRLIEVRDTDIDDYDPFQNIEADELDDIDEWKDS